MKRNSCVVFMGCLLLIMGATRIAVAQSPTMAEADALFQAKEWQKAEEAFEKITKREPENGLAWSRLGGIYHSMRLYAKAITYYKKADELNFGQGRTRYNMACAYALDNKPDEAFEWLENAMVSGFSQTGLLQSDEDIKNLRDDPRFQKILQLADKNANPCEYDERRRSFDFWLGAWDVFNAQGQKMGTNVIEKKAGGCMIYENWNSVLGGGGQSMNYFDPASGKWKQNWVSSNGGVVWYEGEIIDGAMHFMGENIAPGGVRTPARVTLTPMQDGTVTHRIETSPDGGKTWNITFEGNYVKQKVN
ncbi:tetratricopeptide repeat protein [bacterium]|nr:tetratricopeptide repeat protein [bacterium]